jgi:hypothetical protein
MPKSSANRKPVKPPRPRGAIHPLERKTMMVRRLVFSALLLAVAGCADENAGLVPVQGKVTYQGKPVPNGTINFMPDSGRSAYAEIKPDGTYSLLAIPAAHKVVVMALEDNSARLPEERSPTPPPIVPVKYTHIATTDLTAKVEDKGKEPNVIDFDLKDEK